MTDEVRKKLEKLRADYMETTGQCFSHFYCPILFKDEDELLCKAHIINKAFKGSSRAWTVQRKDVDNFYGSHFESDFETLQYAKSQSRSEIFMDKELHKKFDPGILVDDKQIDYFVTEDRIPEQFTPIEFKKDEQSILVGLKMSPDDFIKSADRKWDIEISKDLRVAALVSLIKAAHLTLFDMLGYRYAFSAAGEYVGNQILGEFFRQNHSKKKSIILQNARSFFKEFTTMVRPTLSCGFNFQGTVADKMLLVCWSSSGFPWAIIVFIKTGIFLHSVMLPNFDRIDAVPTFIDFLKNQNESISVTGCLYEQGEAHWKIYKESTRLIWPKKVNFYL